jgi:hypothetical protein
MPFPFTAVTTFLLQLLSFADVFVVVVLLLLLLLLLLLSMMS